MKGYDDDLDDLAKIKHFLQNLKLMNSITE